MQRLWRAYVSTQTTWPLTSSAITGFGVMAIGDGAVQLGGDGSVDVRRNFVVSTFNAGFSPIVFAWLRVLDRRWPGTTLAPLATKVFVNQLVLTPFSSAGFMAWTSHMEALMGASAVDWAKVRADLMRQLERELPGVVTSSCFFWPVVNAISFGVVPLHSRVPFLSVASVAWGGFLSFVSHR